MDKHSFVHEKATLLSNTVLGANDGIVTTFAIIAGSAGASFSPRVVIVLGIAKLFADAVSMSSGVYLGLKSEIDYQKKQDGRFHQHPLAKHSLITFFAFIIAGFLPLIPYIFRLGNSLLISSVIVFIELFIIGSLRTKDTDRKWVLGGLEMLLIGGLAALIAYYIGFLVDKFVIA